MIYEEIFIIDSSFFFFFRHQRTKKYKIFDLFNCLHTNQFKSYDSVVFHHHLFSRSLFISQYFSAPTFLFFFFLFLVFAFFFSFFFIFLSFFYLFIYFFPHFQVTLSLSLWRGENIFKNLYTAPFHLLGKKNFFENWIDIRFTVVNHTCHTRAIYFN